MTFATVEPLTETHHPRADRQETDRTDGVVQERFVGDLDLESGEILPEVTLAFETWGELNEAADNAVLILHALTGDTHVSRGFAGKDASAEIAFAAETPGWWEGIVGPDYVIDTDRYFVLAPNIVGGCYGSTGPSSPAPPQPRC